jgi:hypothetical protein
MEDHDTDSKPITEVIVLKYSHSSMRVSARSLIAPLERSNKHPDFSLRGEEQLRELKRIMSLIRILPEDDPAQFQDPSVVSPPTNPWGLTPTQAGCLYLASETDTDKYSHATTARGVDKEFGQTKDQREALEEIRLDYKVRCIPRLSLPLGYVLPALSAYRNCRLISLVR